MYINGKEVNRKSLSFEQAQGNIYIEYPNIPLSTVLIYDKDAKYVHLLVTNIPNSNVIKGDFIIDYQPPNPPNRHKYLVFVFEQKFPVHITDRRIDISDLEDLGMDIVFETYFFVDRKLDVYQEENPILAEKYCNCVRDVATKQSDKCSRAWFKKIDGETCYNPYAICTKSVGRKHGIKCKEDYNSWTDLELRKYLEQNTSWNKRTNDKKIRK